MPHLQIDCGVLYHVERGPSREQIHDCLRLGRTYGALSRVSFTIRGDHEDYIGVVSAFVQGVHHAGPDAKMIFLMGRFARSEDTTSKTPGPLWSKAFYFAQYNLYTARGRILLGESSFLESPLKRFGEYAEAEPEL